MRFFLVGLLLFLFAFRGLPQESKLIRIDFPIGTRDQSGIIHAICQDYLGYIWIGQNDGLYRFDGYDYKKILTRSESESGISNNNISCILEDSDSLLWIGTKGGGLNLYDRKTDSYSFFTSDSDNPKHQLFNDIASIYEDRFRILWIGTDGGGLYRLDKKTSTFEQILDPEHKTESSSEKVLSIYRNSPDEIYIGTWQNGLKKINLKTGKWDQMFPGLEHFPLNSRRNIWSIAELNSNELILGTFGEGTLIFNNTTRQVSKLKGSRIAHAFSICKDAENTIFVGSETGLEKIQNGAAEIQGTAGEIRVLTFDRDGNLWVGQQQNLWVLKRNRSFFRVISSFPQNKYPEIFNDNQSLIWQATPGKLEKKNTNGKESVVFSLPENRLVNMISDWSENTLVLATNEGVLFFDKIKSNFIQQTNQSAEFKEFIKGNAFSCGQTTDKAIWMSTLGLLYFKNNNREKFISEKLLPGFSMSHYVSSLIQDTDHSLWVGTFGGGLNHINPELNHVEVFKQNFTSKNGISNNFIECMAWDHQHRLWIGTHDGLNLLNSSKSGEFKVFTVKDGLPNNEINSMVADRDGNLWLGTANGLCHLNVEKMEFRNFGFEDGLPSVQFLKHAAFLQNNGQIIMGTTSGVIQFNPLDIPDEPLDLKVHIQSFQLFNEEVSPRKNSLLEKNMLFTKAIQLNYKQNYFGVDFTSFPYFSKENTSYAHQLAGVDKDWQVSKAKSVNYTNVPPGNYILKLKAISGTNISPERTLQIVIIPPWWQSKTAYWLFAALAILGIAFFIYFIANRERRKGRIRLQKFKERKEQEMNDLKFAFFSQVSNELKNPLTLIVNPLNELQNLTKISHPEFKKPLEVMQSGAFQMRQILEHLVDFKKIGTGEHQPNLSVGNLSALLNRNCQKYSTCAKSADKGFYYEVNPESLIASFDAGLLAKIQGNILDFYFNRALAISEIDFKSEVIAVNEQQVLSIKITDNSGELSPIQLKLLLEPFSGGKSIAPVGFALAITHELVKLCEGNMQIENFGGGLKAEIQIPIHPDFEKRILNSENQLNIPNQPAILFVINHTELRVFLSESFKSGYQVLSCGSAEEAIAVLEKKMPELIVSDYELNGLDGLQLYNQLIKYRVTENIPFILLNGEDDQSIKLAALQAGVHSIMVKPFNMEELQAIVRNYFASRNNIKGQLTSDSNSIQLLDVEISDQQKELLDRLLAFMEKNYQDSNLNVELLCVELEMSRPQLYRKLQTLTGLSVQEFIKSFRLKKAAAFLRSGDQRISDVAYMVGFSDPQHFSKSFRIQFGKSPTQYAAEHRD